MKAAFVGGIAAVLTGMMPAFTAIAAKRGRGIRNESSSLAVYLIEKRIAISKIDAQLDILKYKCSACVPSAYMKRGGARDAASW